MADLIHCSFVTLTSVGYGDIVPLHPLARDLANIEALNWRGSSFVRGVTDEIADAPGASRAAP